MALLFVQFICGIGLRHYKLSMTYNIGVIEIVAGSL